MRCAVHSLNNLFQAPVYDKFSVDVICEQLTPATWLNPHRSMLGLGNYDINVLMFALQAAGYEVHWHDRRVSVSSVSSPPLLGFIVHQSTPRLFSLYHAQHWYPIRAFNEGREWFDLNSIKPRPTLIPHTQIVSHCEELLKKESTQLMWIVTRGTSREELYSGRGWGTFTQAEEADKAVATTEAVPDPPSHWGEAQAGDGAGS